MSEQVAEAEKVGMGIERSKEQTRKELRKALKEAADILAQVDCEPLDCDECPYKVYLETPDDWECLTNFVVEHARDSGAI